MPQSEEHLGVIDLLEIDRGVIALSRSDLADEETRELAALEVLERTAGTVAEGWPLVDVAAPTARGIDELTRRLAELIRSDHPDSGRPRLWVDRSFTIAGSGSVVTGTLTGGSLAAGDRVWLHPGGEARVRALQTHEQEVEQLAPGNRAAVNLAGMDDVVTRGAMLGNPGQWEPSSEVLVLLRPRRGLDMPERGAFHLHLGSGWWPVQVRPVTATDAGSVALLRAPRPLPVTAGDRYILRDTGRRTVIGGGRVIDPAPVPGAWRDHAVVSTLVAALDAGPADIAEALLAARGLDDAGRLAAHAAGGLPDNAVRSGGLIMSPAWLAERAAAAAQLVADHHERHPLRAGIPRSELAEQLGIGAEHLDNILEMSSDLVDEGATVRRTDFAGGLTAEAEKSWEEVRAALAASGLAVPRASQLGVDVELLRAFERAGRLVRVGDDLVYLPEQLDDAVTRLRRIEEPFTVANARDVWSVSRRQAVPLLEHLDRSGVTARRGDVRTFRREPGADDARSR